MQDLNSCGSVLGLYITPKIRYLESELIISTKTVSMICGTNTLRSSRNLKLIESLMNIPTHPLDHHYENALLAYDNRV